jgi:hypothetical protein
MFKLANMVLRYWRQNYKKGAREETNRERTRAWPPAAR